MRFVNKTSLFLSACINFFLILSVSEVTYADVAPPQGMKGVKVCHQIETNRFEDLLLVGGLGPSPTTREWSGYDLLLVEPQTCLPSGYRASFDIFAVSAKEWETVSESKDGKRVVKGRKPSSFGAQGIATDRYGLGELRIDSRDPLKSRILVWSVAGLRNKRVVLYVKQIRDQYEGEKNERVEMRDPPVEFKK